MLEFVNNKIKTLLHTIRDKDQHEVILMKEKKQTIEDERETAASQRFFAKMQFEGKKTTKIFCKLNKKNLENAQFEELHMVDKKPNGEEEITIITNQKSIEWEVRKFYW